MLARQDRHRTGFAATWIAGWLVLLTACGGSAAPGPVEPTASRTLLRVPDETPPTRHLIRIQVEPAPYRLPITGASILSDYWDCRGRRRHRALDLVAPGPNGGLGAPILAVARSRIIEIGTPEMDPSRFGRRYTRGPTVTRGDQDLPTSETIDPYGDIYFFTRNYGSSHTGVLLVTEVLDGPLQGHQIRYMHMAAVHPSLSVGQDVAPGQELGLMGGTAIMSSTPHLHIDAHDSNGRRIDLSPHIGLRSRDRDEAPDC